MGGCLRRFGCLLIVLGLITLAWVYKDRWLPEVKHRLGSQPPPSTPAGAQPWDLVTAEEGARAKEQILKLSQRSGPVFTNLSAAGFTGYVVDELSRQLPPSAMGTSATVIGDELFIRTMVRPADLGADALGPLQGALADREPLEMGGTLDVMKPGLGAYTVRSLKVATISVPGPGIPSLLDRISTAARPASMARDALPLVMPVQIADLRVRNGRITLYKAAQ